MTPDETAADVHVLVIAEALKPEDHAAARGGRQADCDGVEQGRPDGPRRRRPVDAGPSPRRRLPGADRGADGADGRLAGHRRPGRRADVGAARAGYRACGPDVDGRVRAHRASAAPRASATTARRVGPVRHRPCRPGARRGRRRRDGIDGAAAGQPGRPGRRAHRGGRRTGALSPGAVGDHRIAFSRSAIRRRATRAVSVDRRRPSSP